MNDTMNDNPYNRVKFDPTVSQWVVIVMTTPDEHPARGGAALATRSAFATREDARLMDQIEALRKNLTATENEALAEYTRRLDEGYHPVTGKRLLTPEEAERMCGVARDHLRSRIVAALERSDDSALREFAQRVRNKEV